MSSAPPLPDGLVAFIKRDCHTCRLIQPVLHELDTAGDLAVTYTQDDPTFGEGLSNLVDDTELAHSWHANIDTVPTLLRVVDGKETDRIVGWSRDMWASFTGIDSLGLGADISDFSPGCGSMSVDPDRTAGLEAKYGDGMASRRVDFASAEDPFEAMYDRGWSDGLPLVPPTPERVAHMLT